MTSRRTLRLRGYNRGNWFTNSAKKKNKAHQVLAGLQTQRSVSRLDLSSRLVMHPVEGVLDQFGRVLEAELALDVFAIGLNRAHTQMQLPGDLPCAATLTDQPENLQLAVGQGFNRRSHDLAPSAGHL